MHIFLVKMVHHVWPITRLFATVSTEQTDTAGLLRAFLCDVESHLLQRIAPKATQVADDSERELTRVFDTFHRSVPLRCIFLTLFAH